MSASLHSYPRWRLINVYKMLTYTEAEVELEDSRSVYLECRATLVSEWLWVKHSLQMFRRVGGYGRLRPPEIGDIHGR